MANSRIWIEVSGGIVTVTSEGAIAAEVIDYDALGIGRLASPILTQSDVKEEWNLLTPAAQDFVREARPEHYTAIQRAILTAIGD